MTKTPPREPTSKRQTEWVFEASPSSFSDPIWCGVGEGDRRRLWEPGWCYEIHSIGIPECTSKGKEPCCHTLELILNLQEFSAAFCHALVWSHKSNVKFLSFFFCHHITPKRLDRFLSNWVDMFGMSLLERTENISKAPKSGSHFKEGKGWAKKMVRRFRKPNVSEPQGPYCGHWSSGPSHREKPSVSSSASTAAGSLSGN